jgi:hypothetical protein
MMEDEFVAREKKFCPSSSRRSKRVKKWPRAVRHIAERLLLGEKGYAPADIRKNVVFEVPLGTEIARSSVDFLVSLGEKPAMVIKCAAGSLSSRERHVVAAARVLGDLPIPVAVVMDPMSAVVLDAATGKLTGEGF